MHKLLIGICLAFGAGCGGTVMTCPRTEAPVLLGPVDRIGGEARPVVAGNRTLRANNQMSFMITHAAGGTYTSARKTPRYAGAAPIWTAHLDPSSDVHVTSARASGFVWDALGAFWMNNEVNVDMTVTKAGGK